MVKSVERCLLVMLKNVSQKCKLCYQLVFVDDWVPLDTVLPGISKTLQQRIVVVLQNGC